jgi:hypothetical protein
MKTFSERCPLCVKKREQGLRTGSEPEPQQRPSQRRPKLTRRKFKAHFARMQLEAAARARTYDALPEARR